MCIKTQNHPKTFYGNNQKYNVIHDYEKLNYSTGRIIYEETDLSLPGVNGLDFNLTLRFNQEDARKYSMIVVPSGIGEEISYHNWPIQCRGLNEIKYGLGAGWSFGFSEFEYWDYAMCLRLSTGEVYKVEENNQIPGKYIIYDRYKNDLELYDAVGEYTDNTGKKSAYTLKYKTGLKEYFDNNGNVMATIDRYGNKIQYYYEETKMRLSSVIDSVGRIITFHYYYPDNSSDAAYVKVLIGTKEMCEYTLLTSTVNEGRYELFMKYTPQSHSVFQYDYFDVYESLPRTTGAELNKQMVLASIHNVAGASHSEYEYEIAREYYEDDYTSIGSQQYARLKKRKDVAENDINVVEYTYDENFSECEYFHNIESYSSTANIVGSGFKTKRIFNEKHNMTELKTVSENDTVLHAETYTYNSHRLPSEKETVYYFDGNIAATENELYSYDNKGNIISYTDKAGNTTSYTYDESLNYSQVSRHKKVQFF